MTLPAHTDQRSGRAEPPTLGVILVAAGRGERLGADIPKAFVELNGRTLVAHALSTLAHLDVSGHAVIVVPDGSIESTHRMLEESDSALSPWQVSIVPGGHERHDSVRRGLEALPESVDLVLVHDAARPLTPAALFDRVISEVRRTGEGVIPVLPVADTLKRVDAHGRSISTEDRAALRAAQTPQGFLRAALESAYEHLERTNGTDPLPTDDAEVLQRFGGAVRTVPGDRRAHKVTEPFDLMFLEALLHLPEAGATPDSREGS